MIHEDFSPCHLEIHQDCRYFRNKSVRNIEDPIINRDASLFDYWRIGYKSVGIRRGGLSVEDKEVSIKRLRASLRRSKDPPRFDQGTKT